MTIRAETLRGGPEIVAILAEEWRMLCDASGSPLPFSRPEWVAAYFRNNKKAKFLIVSVRMNGKLRAVLPLIERTKRFSYLPATVLRGPSDFDLWPFEISIDSGAESLTVEKTLWDAVQNLGGWDILELPNMARGGAAESLLRIAAAEGYPTHRWEYMRSPYISLSDYRGVKDPLEIVRSLNLKKNVKKILRKLENEGGIKVHHLEKADPAILQRLYELEASGWKGEKGSAILLKQADRTFWDEITQWGQQFGFLSLHALEMQGQIVGASVGLNYRDRYYGLKLGWDERYRSYSLGHLLLHSVLETCLRCGVSELHMMGLRSRWKEQWTKKNRAYATCYVFRKGLYGLAVRTAKFKAIAWEIRNYTNKEGQIEESSLGSKATEKRGGSVVRAVYDRIDDTYDRVLKLFDTFLVPVGNVLFDFYARKFQWHFKKKTESVIDKSLRYFDSQKELTFDAVGAFTFIINKSFEPRLSSLDEKIRFYAEKWNDPHLRLLDSNYNPEKREKTAQPIDLTALSRVEKPLLRCIYADQLGADENLLKELEAIDDNGGYGTTHKLLGYVILKKFSLLPGEVIERLIKSCIGEIFAAQRYACAGDLFSERTVLLQWLAYDHLVSPSWIIRIARAQMRDGGWYWKRSLRPKSHQHPSCLGLAALIQYREKHFKGEDNTSAARPSEIGEAFLLCDKKSGNNKKDYHDA